MYIVPDYPIRTARLRLRPFTRGDVEAVYAYRARDDVARYLFDPALSLANCTEAVQQRIAQIGFVQEGDKAILAVELARTGQLIGEVSLIWRSMVSAQGEIGYIFNPEFHGHGYATEAGAALLELGFSKLELHRICARCHDANVASQRVMERLGMRREAHFRQHMRLKGVWISEYIYALLHEEWARSRGAGR